MIQVDSSGQAGRACSGRRPGIQCAEAKMAVRLEWTHAKFFGQGEGLAVAVFGRLDRWGI